jgi:hypothetical protein
VSGVRIRLDLCVWRKDTMGMVCLAEGYDGTGVSGRRLAVGSPGAIIVASSPAGCK